MILTGVAVEVGEVRRDLPGGGGQALSPCRVEPRPVDVGRLQVVDVRVDLVRAYSAASPSSRALSALVSCAPAPGRSATPGAVSVSRLGECPRLVRSGLTNVSGAGMLGSELDEVEDLGRNRLGSSEDLRIPDDIGAGRPTSAVPDRPSSSALMAPSAVRSKFGRKQATEFRASSVAIRWASGWRTMRPTTWAMWVASLAGRSEYRTSARGQSHPVEIASWQTRCECRRRPGSTLAVPIARCDRSSSIDSCSPNTCMAASGQARRPFRLDDRHQLAELLRRRLVGTCTTMTGSTSDSFLAAEYEAHRCFEVARDADRLPKQGRAKGARLVGLVETDLVLDESRRPDLVDVDLHERVLGAI